MPVSLVRTVSSLPGLRPANAHRRLAGAWRARYSAVRAPVKPVAPNTTMSKSRESFMPRVFTIGVHGGT